MVRLGAVYWRKAREIMARGIIFVLELDWNDCVEFVVTLHQSNGP